MLISYCIVLKYNVSLETIKCTVLVDYYVYILLILGLFFMFFCLLFIFMIACLR